MLSNKPVYWRKGGEERVQVVHKQETVDLDSGDIIYLYREGGIYLYGYLVQIRPDDNSKQEKRSTNWNQKKPSKCIAQDTPTKTNDDNQCPSKATKRKQPPTPSNITTRATKRPKKDHSLTAVDQQPQRDIDFTTPTNNNINDLQPSKQASAMKTPVSDLTPSQALPKFLNSTGNLSESVPIQTFSRRNKVKMELSSSAKKSRQQSSKSKQRSQKIQQQLNEPNTNREDVSPLESLKQDLNLSICVGTISKNKRTKTKCQSQKVRQSSSESNVNKKDSTPLQNPKQDLNFHVCIGAVSKKKGTKLKEQNLPQEEQEHLKKSTVFNSETNPESTINKVSNVSYTNVSQEKQLSRTTLNVKRNKQASFETISKNLSGDYKPTTLTNELLINSNQVVKETISQNTMWQESSSTDSDFQQSPKKQSPQVKQQIYSKRTYTPNEPKVQSTSLHTDSQPSIVNNTEPKNQSSLGTSRRVQAQNSNLHVSSTFREQRNPTKQTSQTNPMSSVSRSVLQLQAPMEQEMGQGHNSTISTMLPAKENPKSHNENKCDFCATEITPESLSSKQQENKEGSLSLVDSRPQLQTSMLQDQIGRNAPVFDSLLQWQNRKQNQEPDSSLFDSRPKLEASTKHETQGRDLSVFNLVSDRQQQRERQTSPSGFQKHRRVKKSLTYKIKDQSSLVNISTKQQGLKNRDWSLSKQQQQQQMETHEVLKPRLLFEGLSFAFWVHQHVGILKQRIVEQGGQILAGLSDETDLVICGNDTYIKQQQVQELTKFDKVKVVKMVYATECLARKKLLDTKKFQLWPKDLMEETSKRITNEQSSESNSADKVNIFESSAKADKQADDGNVDREGIDNEGQIDGNCEDFIPLNTQNSDGEISIVLEKTQEVEYLQEKPIQRGRVRGRLSYMLKDSIEKQVQKCSVVDYTAEEYDEQLALATLKKLKSHWYKVAPNAMTNQENTEDVVVSVSTQKCFHLACSQLGFCVVEQLEKVRDNYQKVKDQFRRRAVVNGITVVKKLTFPLQDDSKIDELRGAPFNLGTKTVEKIREIVATGKLSRNQELAKNPKQQAIKELTKIWGVGEATAENWYQQGCCTLEDVKKREDLSVQQKVGVKYYDDLQYRIPRDEVKCSAEAICEVVRQVLKIPKQDLFAKVLGSYVRGKDTSGDVDVLIVLPTYMQDVQCCKVLKNILQRLYLMKMITDDVSMEGGKSLHGNATWLGVGRPIDNPYVRRIDIKVYPPQMKVFAVNYFIGDEYFNRALRYFCNTPIQDGRQRAKEVNESASCFKLSDHGMYPAVRNRIKSTTGQLLVPVGPSFQFQNETQIFEMAGLNYVPPHMRNMK